MRPHLPSKTKPNLLSRASTDSMFDKRMEVEQEAEQQQPSVRQNWLQSGFLKAVISPRGGKLASRASQTRSQRHCQALAEPLPPPNLVWQLAPSKLSLATCPQQTSSSNSRPDLTQKGRELICYCLNHHWSFSF